MPNDPRRQQLKMYSMQQLQDIVGKVAEIEKLVMNDAMCRFVLHSLTIQEADKLVNGPVN